MQDPSDWRAELVQAVEIELAATDSRGGGWKSLGPARAGSQPGHYELDLRGSPVSADSLDQLCLAGRRGPDHGAYVPVTTARLEGGVLHLDVSGAVPKGCESVWTVRPTSQYLAMKLRDGLRKMPDGLAKRLVERSLSPVDSSDSGPDGLLPPQRAAYRACLSPGLRLVWGPPGTGKTTVLARALEDLAGSGKRTLLVSNTNVAVDNAIVEVARRLERGKVVRVGTPHRKDLAANPDVLLEGLTVGATAAAESEVRDLVDALAAFDTRSVRVAELKAELTGFDMRRFVGVEAKILRGEAVGKIDTEINGLRARIPDLESRFVAADARRQQLSSTWDRADGVRRDLESAATLNNQLGAAVHRMKLAEAAVRRSAQHADDAHGLMARRRARKELQSATKEFENCRASCERETHELPGLIAECLRRAAPWTAETIAEFAAELDAANRASAAAQFDLRDVHDAVRRLESKRAELVAQGIASAQDRAFHQECVEADLPTKHEELSRLENKIGRPSRADLEGQLRAASDRVRKLRNDAEKEIIDSALIVATTLARSRIKPAICEGNFDVVLVDEVGAARLADVVLAVSYAKQTAVLLGDFLQLGPIVDKKRTDDLVKKWLHPDVFEHIGIRSGRDAASNPGCVALRDQFRFGPGVRKLANDVIYGVLRDGPGLRNDSDIVVIDTAGAPPDLCAVHRPDSGSRWWSIGSMLSRAIAEHHGGQSESVGVVVPYRAQVKATLTGLQDADSPEICDVGTVHAFQGREFDVVVFDLVEDGKGWISQAGRGSEFAYNGVRMFGVGVTRVRHRLYLVVDFRVVKAARKGTPLAALHDRYLAGDVTVHSAAQLLGLEPVPATIETVPDLRESLSRYVEVDEILDEVSFPESLARLIVGAGRSIWLWAPWTGRRSAPLLPLLRAAVERGVDVRAFVRTDADRNMQRETFQHWLSELAATGTRIIRADVEHRKVVVVDELVVVNGSYNPLSQHRSREIMISQRGRAWAQRILDELHADDHADPPRCVPCRRDFQLYRSQSTKRGQVCEWRCATCAQTRVPQCQRGNSRVRRAS